MDKNEKRAKKDFQEQYDLLTAEAKKRLHIAIDKKDYDNLNPFETFLYGMFLAIKTFDPDYKLPD